MIRGILGAIAGVIAGGIVIFLIEVLGHFLYPFPPGIDPHDHKSLEAYMKTAPIGAWLVVLSACALGSFAGGASGAWIGRKPWAGWASGALLMSLGLVNLLMMFHPAWFWVASLALYLPAAWVGVRLVRRPPG